MLLYQKPLSDIEIGDTFEVTVTEADWNMAKLVSCCELRSSSCVLAQALKRHFTGTRWSVNHLNASADCYGLIFDHDGIDLVKEFDSGWSRFPGEAVVHFKRLV